MQRSMEVFYSENDVSLIGGEDRVITMECAAGDLKSGPAKVVLDGWNATVQPASAEGVSIELNEKAQVDGSPRTGFTFR